MAQVAGSLLPMQEIQVESLVPGFGLAKSWLSGAFGGVTQKMGAMSLRLSNKLNNFFKKYMCICHPISLAKQLNHVQIHKSSLKPKY